MFLCNVHIFDLNFDDINWNFNKMFCFYSVSIQIGANRFNLKLMLFVRNVGFASVVRDDQMKMQLSGLIISNHCSKLTHTQTYQQHRHVLSFNSNTSGCLHIHIKYFQVIQLVIVGQIEWSAPLASDNIRLSGPMLACAILHFAYMKSQFKMKILNRF